MKTTIKVILLTLFALSIITTFILTISNIWLQKQIVVEQRQKHLIFNTYIKAKYRIKDEKKFWEWVAYTEEKERVK